MAEGNRKETLEREALGYIRLGTLVQRLRTEERAEAVAKVLAESLPIEEKIRRIERIDLESASVEEYRAPPSVPPSLSRGSSLAAAAPRERRVKQSVIAAAKRRARIKLDILPSTFLAYLFREGAELRKNAKTNHFIRAGFFSVSFEEANARAFLEQLKSAIIPLLQPALDTALREGWRFLRKSDYNRLAALNRLLAEINALDPRHISPHDPTSARRLYGLEIAFLPLKAEASGRDEQEASLETVLSKLSYPKAELDVARGSARRILQGGGPPACLQDLVLAINMARSRRFLTLSDLMRPESEPLLSLSEFDCGEELQEAIDAHIATLLARLDAFSEETDKVLRLRAFVCRDESGDIDYRPLVALYESGENKNLSWQNDRDNVMRSLAALMEKFISFIAPLLGKGSPADKGKGASGEREATARRQAPAAKPVEGARLLEDVSLEYEVSRMRGTVLKLERALAGLPSLPWARFLALRSRSAQATSFEAEGMGLIIEAADLFYRVGIRLAELLRLREVAGTEDAAAAIASGFAAGSVVGLAAVERLSLEDMAFRQSLSTAASVAYLAALRFQEPTIAAALKNERMAEDQRRSLLVEIERLADAEVFQEARRKIGAAPAEQA